MIRMDESVIRVEVEPVDYVALSDYAACHPDELLDCFLDHCADDEVRGFVQIFEDWRRDLCQSS